MNGTLVTIGRILLGVFFIVLGLAKLKGVVDTGGLAGLAGYIGSRGLPQPQILAVLTIAFEIIGGLALVFGYFTMPIAFLMAGFCLATAAFFHHFWTFPTDQVLGQFQNFMKNIGLMGAYLVLAGDSLRARA